MKFVTAIAEIEAQLQSVDPIGYAHTRNYINGAVTHLGPYLSRGVISTKDVLESVLTAGHDPQQVEKFIQELAWRDYWQQQWIVHRDRINEDMKHPQPNAMRTGIPTNMLKHQCGIAAIDQGVKDLYDTGYMHNHLRMYAAALSCNVAKCHWHVPAQWMYYHLLDADWASNALSWQWVCGSNSHKVYYANQENINKYCFTDQHQTYLDYAYEDFPKLSIPEALSEVTEPLLKTSLPPSDELQLRTELPTLIYNFYNIDPQWRSDLHANRILLLEPTVFSAYPVSQKSIDFCIALAKENIPGVKVFVSEFSSLKAQLSAGVYFKEHPLNNYIGTEDSRSWMTSVKGDFPSFFAFWKKCKKEIC